MTTLPEPRRHEPPWKHLDPGIAAAVRLLWDAGFQTTDSGDGVSKPDAGRVLDFPHVFVVTGSVGAIANADWIHSWNASEWGDLGSPRIEVSYSPRYRDIAIIAVLWPPEETP